MWRQTRGSDVTGGSGALSGRTITFAAPDDVMTLTFELTVNDGSANSTPDSVQVNVMENSGLALFVDGDNGSDAMGNGSRNNPFATIAHALSRISVTPEDIYVKSRANSAFYDEVASELDVPSGTSLYGGFNDKWIRDTASNKTLVHAKYSGIEFVNVTQDAWFSGFQLTTADSPDAGTTVLGVAVAGDTSAAMHVRDNVIETGNVATGTNAAPGSNYGLRLIDLRLADVADNVLNVGTAGNGSAGTAGATGAKGDNGNNGNRTGGNQASGGSGGPGGNGGSGGTRGGGLSGSGGRGADGSTGTNPLNGTTVAPGTGGAGGVTQTSVAKHGTDGNTGGNGRPGAAGSGFGSASSTLFLAVNGQSGSTGGAGSGGGGGGGGAANSVGGVGGGGGGGGEGGAGGTGGTGGASAGASIGVWLHNIGTSNLNDNMITAGNAGIGGNGASGGDGGLGGAFGVGAAGDDQGILGAGGSGGDGGDGGNGGIGGTGGAGGGGPSFGVVFSGGMAPTLTNNDISAGNGGRGGSGGVRGNGGEGGYTYAIFDRNTSDAFFAVLDQNTLSFGTAGAGGSSSQVDGTSRGAAGGSGERNWP